MDITCYEKIKNMSNIYTYKGAKLSVLFNSNSMMVRDIQRLTDHPVIEISNVTSINKNKGEASMLLNSVVDMFPSYIILVKAEPMFETEEEYKACGDLDERINSLVQFYTNRGFIDINHHIGYQCGVAMCYINEPYKDLVSAL